MGNQPEHQHLGRAAEALLIGNGEPPSRALFDYLVSYRPLLLCADGGANTALEYGYTPDYIVGDLDSVTASGRARVPESRLVRVDADNTGTDMQKVLEQALRLGVRRAVLAGFTGRRTDHILWNLSLLRTFADRVDLYLADDHCDIRLIRGHITLTGYPGMKLSLCPLMGPVHGIRTSGLRFPLQDESLIPGVRDGISNEISSNPVSVTVGEGDLLLVLQREGAIDLGVQYHDGGPEN